MSKKNRVTSEIFGVNFIKIGPAMTSGYLFEKMWFYMKYIVIFLSGNRYVAHNCNFQNCVYFRWVFLVLYKVAGKKSRRAI
jgi:hypothetical protein